ncbi:MAG: GH3 auxin-responsive promoter family protein [Elusimicrobia bacterium]|nr:GH3 auxin-responsive promoter family protein [Elusimicrobiota bacterium]
MLARAIPSAARLVTAAAHRRALIKLDRPEEAQGRLLEALVAELARTAYGRSLGVKASDGYHAFRAKVPVSDYSGLRPWLQRWKAGENGTLSTGRALFWQKTSGSGGPAKDIPCTPGLLGSFRHMFSAWLGDVLRNGPDFETGSLFVSLSPVSAASAAPQSEQDYLGAGLRALLDPIVTPPSSLLALREPANFRRALRLALLSRADRLEALSVWNPTAFTVILDEMLERRAEALADCRRGFVKLEGRAWEFGAPAESTIEALRLDALWSRVFPKLKFISCWNDAWAKPAAERLGSLFPGALLQGKGLLATEAPVTIPLIGAPGCLPLSDEVYCEFESGGRVVPLGLVERGAEYSLVITTKGGLWRYRLGDRVRCTGRWKATPTLELIGRADGVVDLVGEKLAEPFVESSLRELGLEDVFKTLVPVRADRGASYYLLWVGGETGDAAGLARALDERLSASHRYREARAMGQLKEPRVVGRADAERRYLDFLTARGMRRGDIKPRSLVRQPMDERDVREYAGGQG